MPKVFFITGAGSGIGRVTARYLLERGYRVFLTDYNSAFLDDTCTKHLPSALSPEFQSNFKWALMDTTNHAQVVDAIKKCANEFGSIDVLINNAGINSQYMRAGIRMDQVPTSDFEHVLQVNLVGTYRVSQQAIPYLAKSPGGGVIVNLSSCRATQQGKHGEAYTASKAGIEGLTMAMSVSLGPDIRVHAISPGMVDVRSERDESALPDVNTIREDLSRDFQSEHAPQWGAGKSQALHDAHPVGRIGKGDDVARWIEFLSVTEAGFTTGGTYLVDGGYSKTLVYPN
ncbi:uncharacterized protein N7443_005963 [Penicillium atrosanguineum]|uniref:uncharacterized protein n=1 Tax=Penicillium atrosanguineum TaxID=1132637 RepID=UPI002385D85E|nr:uncharacterized protein N7443_005963 [Penicillium atrosanguineum]KAJ5300961.1 hypothetical protein N7443_005963 [Penicillium atrosanguineum]